MNIITNDTKYLIALSHFAKFGAKRLKLIQNFFPDFESAFKASINELITAGIPENVALEFSLARENINIEKIINFLGTENIGVISILSEDYPSLLKEIFDPPIILYYKGTLTPDTGLNLAVVGSRKHTSYGQQVTHQLVADLTRQGLTIVSGLALGIDTYAHNTCVDNNGRTIAVLGSGIDKRSLYPSANRYLAEKIVANGGLILSEYPVGTEPLRYNFPQRNRIISGLSLGTLVIEANEKSGALITAECALEHNREVFAIPGNIYSPSSIGPNNLIKQGAKIVTTAEEIIEALNLNQVKTFIENKNIIPETAEEAVILVHLKKIPMHINELIRLSGLDTASINSTLTIMEMKGIVKNLGGMEYVLL